MATPDLEILSLVEGKVRVLERFMELNLSFIAEFDSQKLMLHMKKRAQMIKMMEVIDQKTTTCLENYPELALSEEQKIYLRNLLSKKDEMIHRMETIDQQIAECIDQDTKMIQSEINKQKKSQENMGKFKSKQNAESGKQLDKEL